MSVVIVLSGCAARTHDVLYQNAPVDPVEQRVSTALLENKPAVAREALAPALRAQPQNGGLHLLNGLSYQIENGSLQSLALAKVGYDAAVRLAPGNYWSHYLDGSVAIDLSDYREAAEHFSSAILSDPERPQAFLGLAISTYFAGDLEVAQAAADRALALSPMDPMAFRTAAYVAAARGQRVRLDAISTKADAVPIAAHDLEIHKSRLAQLLRNAMLAQVKLDSDERKSGDQPTTASSPKEISPLNQVMVEVTLLLDESSIVHNTGINLLDGLTAQFGLERQTAETVMTDTPVTNSRIFTTAIRMPQIAYSLNLFNTREDTYRVIARPSLVAYLGEQSDFFIGRTVTVGVSGINLGSLQPIDVGTSVSITPVDIMPGHARFRVEVIRSFFTQEPGGTFSQSLTTFKQKVSATAEVEFGKTLILSGLYEAVSARGSSKTPVVGDIPVVDTFFNQRTRTDRRDVALVLLTPTLPGLVETDTREFRGDTLRKLLDLWKGFVDPASNMDAIIGTIGKTGRISKLLGARVGDLQLPTVSDPKTLRLVIQDTMEESR